MQKQIETYIDAHREEIIRQWADLVNLEGESKQTDALETVAQHLYDLFTEAGVSCEFRRGHPEAPRILCGVIGADRPGQPILFSGHYDTVFQKGTFGDKPFRIDEDGKAHGPGCLDMKGGIIITLYVIKALESIGWNYRPIRVVFCGDEEGGLPHFESAAVMQGFAKGCQVAFNMETGPISNALCVGRKGTMIGAFTVKGVSAHSGNNFEAGRNAIVEAAHKMLDIDALTDMEKGTNMNVAVVQGGKMWNSVPDYCKVDFSGRFAQTAEMERVMAVIPEILDRTYIAGTTTAYTPGLSGGVFEQTQANTALWNFVSGISRMLGYGEMGHVFLGGGSDAGQIAAAGVTTLCSCGVVGEWNHTDREYAAVESMFTRTKLWCAVAQLLDDFKE